MHKLLKRLLIGVLAAACCLCVFAAACGDDGGSSDSTYTVKLVYADGTAVNGTTDGIEGVGMFAQFCDDEQCFNPVEFNENGIAQVKADDLPRTPTHLALINADVVNYTFTVNGQPFNANSYNDGGGMTLTSAGEIVIVLTPVTAS